jgi:nucleotide-binding universal stress UspA family protein
MNYKSMTVCLDNSAESSRRLDFALTLAAQNGAHLTGLHLTYLPNFYYDPYAQWAPMMVEWQNSAQKKRDLVKENFRTVARNAGLNVNWVNEDSTAFRQIVAHGRTSDLIILGQRNPSDSETDLGENFPERFILKLGRPVLLLPHEGVRPKAFGRIVIAWDGGREAARAMADAMPFLKKAQQVTILTIAEKIDKKNDLPDVDIAAYLAKHDVIVEVDRNEDIDVTPADWLLYRAADIRADLIVMGAYGHSRFTELIMGGTTRAMLKKMTIPVLMSH